MARLSPAQVAALALMHAALVLLTAWATGWDWWTGATVLALSWALALPLVGLGWLLERLQRR